MASDRPRRDGLVLAGRSTTMPPRFSRFRREFQPGGGDRTARAAPCSLRKWPTGRSREGLRGRRSPDCYEVRGLTQTVHRRSSRRGRHAIDWSKGPIPWARRLALQRLHVGRGSIWRNWFSTIRTPNQTCCTMDDQSWWFIMKPTSSYHSGEVSATVGDGSVKFFKGSRSIARSGWP